MDAHTWIYYVQAGFNNLSRLVVFVSAGLAYLKYRKSVANEQDSKNYHRLRHTQHDIYAFKNKLKPRIKQIYQSENNKALLNKQTHVVLSDSKLSLHGGFDDMPDVIKKVVMFNTKCKSLIKSLDAWEEWALDVLYCPNSFNLLYMETHDDLVPFIKHYKSELNYVIINEDKYRAVKIVFDEFLRRNRYDQKHQID